jgi:large conductance mechanosensitive channel
VVRPRNRVGGFLHDFREFALKGNVVDLAVAVIIGGAFGRIINSLVEDVIMPALVNPILDQAGADWREATIGPGIAIGSFFGAVVDFLIIALILFLMIRSIERTRRAMAVQKAEAEADAAEADPVVESQEKLTEAIDRLTTVMQARS